MAFEMRIKWDNIYALIPVSVAGIFIWFLGTFVPGSCENFGSYQPFPNFCIFGSDISFGLVFLLVIIIFLVLIWFIIDFLFEIRKIEVKKC